MPFQERSVVMLREEFTRLATEGANVSELCRRFGVARRTGYRWLRRYGIEGAAGLVDRSRRPHRSPRQTSPDLEQTIVELRLAHPAWGGRKLAARLRAMGVVGVPAPSTVTAVLRRHGLLDGPGAGERRAFIRFEHDRPNALWQMDFKGHLACGRGRCHPLTALDDHSRYNIVLDACADERTGTVQDALVSAFRAYGLPERIGVDNGSPWSEGPGHRYTALTLWVMRLGVSVMHSRPYHPQTLGKEERFHRTLKAEVLGRPLADLADAQRRFDSWRHVYNYERPHEALGDAVPASRYRPSARAYPEQLPPLEYPSGDLIRRVQASGLVDFRGRRFRLSKALRGYPVAFRPTDHDGCYDIFFASSKIAEVDLTATKRGVSHVPEHMAPISPV